MVLCGVCMLVMGTVLLLSRNGVPLSPLVVCRLLLVFDYLMFQFSEPVEQLTEQVCSNLTLYTHTLLVRFWLEWE